MAHLIEQLFPTPEMHVLNLNNYNYTVNRIHKEKIKEKEAAEWLNVFLKKSSEDLTLTSEMQKIWSLDRHTKLAEQFH